MKKYNIHDLVGKYCMTLEDGQTVYQLIHPELIADHPVEVDFAGVDFFASPFFNFAIGQLLGDIKPETLNRLLKVSNLNPVGKQVLKAVIENSKRYYSDEYTRKAVDKVVSEQANSL
ncbi:MAG: STAS-like domain-containing protein [Coleofasciculus sp. A1-SPW-01]|uniref:STAS-like domain-containing protein n=1 Tax=Coleofasciculus TaxID=669368 RepID=UPI000304FE00|nr:STAS-like domain-containing protein [Coleofasciculus chthonoplastes]